MNSLKGHIAAVETQDELSLVRIDVTSMSVPQTDLASPAVAGPAPSSITVARTDVPRSTMAQTHASPESGAGDRSRRHILSAIVIDTPASADWLRIDHPVKILFKPTEVMIALPGPLAVSVQNKLPCTINSIKTGRLLCQLELRFGNETIHSIITRNACEQLALTQGLPVIALIKTNEVSISAHD